MSVVVGGCAVTLPVRTLPAGETRLVASVGEPLATHLLSAGVPYVTAGILHGLRDGTTVSADLHLLLAVAGVAGVDGAIAERGWRQSGLLPEMTAEVRAGLFYGSGGGRILPSTSLTASWSAGPHTLLYTGGTLTAQLVGSPTFFVSPSVGVQHDLGRRWTGQIEWRLLAANVDTRAGLLEGTASFAGNGGMVIQLGAQWKWR